MELETLKARIPAHYTSRFGYDASASNASRLWLTHVGDCSRVERWPKEIEDEIPLLEAFFAILEYLLNRLCTPGDGDCNCWSYYVDSAYVLLARVQMALWEKLGMGFKIASQADPVLDPTFYERCCKGYTSEAQWHLIGLWLNVVMREIRDCFLAVVRYEAPCQLECYQLPEDSSELRAQLRNNAFARRYFGALAKSVTTVGITAHDPDILAPLRDVLFPGLNFFLKLRIGSVEARIMKYLED